MAEPSERHSRFWSPATQIALSAQNAQIIQNVAPINNGTLRRRRLIRKSGHPSSAETLSENSGGPLVAANLSGEGLGLGFGLDEVKEAVEGLDLRLTRHIDHVDSQHFLPVIAVDENRRRIRMAFSSSNGGQ